MKLTFIIIILVYSCVLFTSAIRVPTTWRSNNNNNTKNKNQQITLLTKYRPVRGSENVYNKPHYKNKNNPIVHQPQQQQQRKQQKRNKIQKKRRKVVQQKKTLSDLPYSTNDWVPIVPNYYNQNPLLNNYRDDRTHEPSPTYDKHLINEEYKTFDREQHEKAPISDHEVPLDVPTRPIYPGEGKWSKRGQKYRPFISKHEFTKLDDDANEERPDGYDVFVKGEQLFHKQNDDFEKNLKQFPQKHQLGEFKEEIHEDEDENDEESAEFVPTKLYAQVRRSEDEEHLPIEEADNGRLREVIKDSKIQTVYTEEGYEDSAYDHAGHEKNAENDEGFAEFNKHVDEEKEKKVPKRVPKLVRYRNSYGDQPEQENENVEDYKRKKLSFDDNADSEIAGSEYVEPIKPVNKKKKINKNNFIKTKETKLMAVKDKGNGTMEMEISSEVKVILQPNNSTKSHKYIKIYPKVYKSLQAETEPSVIVEELNNGTNFVETTTAAINLETTEEIPTTIPSITTVSSSEPTTENILNSEEVIKNIDKAFGAKIRRRRFVNDLPNIEVDTDFIDKIQHTVPAKVKVEDNKYPYYKMDNEILNENSPLRYAEAMENIPIKIEGKMSFYEQAEKKVKCPEIETDVDPIPDRIKNADENGENDDETEEEDKMPKGPRLGMLGDKIDCLKVRYFGENPLDSPIFKEELVEPVKPIFKELGAIIKTTTEQAVVNKIKSGYEETEDKTVEPKNLEIQSTTESIGNYREPEEIQESSEEVIKNENDDDNEIIQNKNFNVDNIHSKLVYSSKYKIPEEPVINENSTNMQENFTTTEPSVISIITTPNYTIDLQPKHIYDQIKLLQYLPYGENNDTTNRESKNLEINSNNETSSENTTTTTDELLPEAEALVRRRRFRPKRPYNYQLFDVNRYMLATTPYPLMKQTTSTVLPKYKVVSEVFYKDEIKPNEQLNVFADVINNIKNSTLNEDLNSSNSQPISITLNTLKASSKRIKVPTKKIRIKNPNHDLDRFRSEEFYTTIPPSTTTVKLFVRDKNKIKSKTNQQLYEELYETLKNRDSEETADESQDYSIEISKVKKRRRRPMEKTLPNDSIDYMEDPVTDVLGLVPPGHWDYKTIYNPKLEKKAPTSIYSVMEDTEVNKFIVHGMKPPKENQKVYLYSDYKLLPTNNKIKRRTVLNRRAKRSANRPAYSELSRNRGKQEEQLQTTTPANEDEDDYVPHRPKNYHYDEKTGKIVYDKPKEVEKVDEDEEYVEIIEEVTEAPVKTTAKSIFANVTPPPPGSSYIDFVNKLKSDKNYHSIPDPTTTERGAEVVTETTTTTVQPVATKPPEFLSILAKVHTDSSYKKIEDKTTTIKPKTTTAEKVVEEEEQEEVEEEPTGPVQNSRGGESAKNDAFQIFDITEFIPKMKNYLPRTSVDTSKYKTIERPIVRHNLSSRYNSDDEKPSDVNTSRRPIILEMKQDDFVEINPVESESKVETTTKHLTTSTTTEEPTTTTTRRVRTRGRKRVTTVRSIEPSTDTPRTTTTTTERVVVQHEKPKRNYIRRRPTRIKLRTTTEKNLEEESGDDTTKIVRRRSETETSIITEDHTESFEPIVVEEYPTVDRLDEDVAELEVKNERKSRIRTPEDNKNRTNDSLGQPGVINPRKVDGTVEIFRKYDENQRHGGNYRSINLLNDQNGAETNGKRPIERLTDIIPKPDAFYTDPKLPSHINQLQEVDENGMKITNLEEIVSIEDETTENLPKADDDFNADDDEIVEITTNKPTTIKKSIIVKDPSKRLYFYAKP